MLPKKFRLTKQTDFKNIFKKGSKSFGKFFSIRYLANNLDNCRFAVVVSNKVSKKAVVRNRLRRQIRSILNDNLSKFSQKNDIIINILTSSVDSNYKTLEKELLNILKNNKLI